MNRKAVLGLMVVLAAGTAAVLYFRQREADQGPIVLHGNVDIRSVDLAFRVSGRIAEVLKDEGDSIQQGEVLARLDPAPFQAELASAQAALQAAAAQEALKRAGYRPEDIAQAQASLDQANAQLDNARTTFRRQSQLVAKGAVPRQTYDDAEAAQRVAEQQVKVATANLALLQAGFRTEEIDAAAAASAQARAAVETARIRLSDAELTAPSGGILLTRAEEPGAIVSSSSTVLTLSLENPVWVRAYVHEPELGKFPPGKAVELFTDSRPDQPYHGHVGFVSPRAEFTPKPVETEELRTSLVYRMRVIVDDADAALRQGMPVTLRATDSNP
ncbi:HlyD family secretion protein [Haloferula luteola]|uniref:HlyD family secretion protein n=1 Tax=Haloferula luteola TaxID=595692 RepID=A0A840V0W6_9BACT|nr:secretion protein HlyD [Haloferula luteola]MBB5350993.1 HlyD family secretion protein [Haloferula luteola]